MKYAEIVENEFRRLHAETPTLVRSPGRVNLIGEHTDYNEGYVLPAAINKAIVFAIAPREDQRCSICALDLKDVCELDLGRLASSAKGWPNLSKAVSFPFKRWIKPAAYHMGCRRFIIDPLAKQKRI